MKRGILFGSFVLLLGASVSTTRLANAQPEHRDDRHFDDHRDDRHFDDRRFDHRDDHRVLPPDPAWDARVRDRLRLEQVRFREVRRDHIINVEAWRASRIERAEVTRRELRETWGDLAWRPEARGELALHAERMARLNRILDVAEQTGNAPMQARAQAVIDAENARHARVMADFRARFG